MSLTPHFSGALLESAIDTESNSNTGLMLSSEGALLESASEIASDPCLVAISFGSANERVFLSDQRWFFDKVFDSLTANCMRAWDMIRRNQNDWWCSLVPRCSATSYETRP